MKKQKACVQFKSLDNCNRAIMKTFMKNDQQTTVEENLKRIFD